MMVDVTGFSRMMGANEEHTVTLIQNFQRLVKQLVDESEGRVVDTSGDSALGEFDSVVNAVRCARRIQEEQARLNRQRPAGEELQTRIGLHLGDVIVEDYTVYGDGVNIAARLESLAEPGSICLSEAVYQQIRNKLDLPIEDMGVKELKNIEHPIRLYRVPPLAGRAAVPASPAEPSATNPPAPPSSIAAALDGLVSQEDIEATVQSWLNDIIRAKRLIPLIIGLFLLLSPAILFRTGGVFPAAGAILVSLVLGRVWALRSGRHGNLLIALGFGIAATSVLTSWSSVTNVLFILAGLIVAATGLGRERRW
jgi:class 3 adenylate cyclase